MKRIISSIVLLLFSTAFIFSQDVNFSYKNGILQRKTSSGKITYLEDFNQIQELNSKIFLIYDYYRDDYISSDKSGLYIFDSNGNNIGIVEGLLSQESDKFVITSDEKFVYQWTGTWIWGSISIYNLDTGDRIYCGTVGSFIYQNNNKIVFTTTKDEGIPYTLPDEVHEVVAFNLSTLQLEMVAPAKIELNNSRILTIESPYLVSEDEIVNSVKTYTERTSGSNKFYLKD